MNIAVYDKLAFDNVHTCNVRVGMYIFIQYNILSKNIMHKFMNPIKISSRWDFPFVLVPRNASLSPSPFAFTMRGTKIWKKSKAHTYACEMQKKVAILFFLPLLSNFTYCLLSQISSVIIVLKCSHMYMQKHKSTLSHQ